MPTRFSLLIVLGWLACVSSAAPASEGESAAALLPHDSVLYFRFDGMSSHREAYHRTVASRVLRDEFGPLIDDLTARVLNALGAEVLSEQLLAGADPSQLLKLQSAQKELPHLKDYLVEHGFLVAAEIIDPMQPRFQVSIVFPGGGRPEHRAAIVGGFRLFALLAEETVQESTTDGEVVLTITGAGELEPRAMCWRSGEHMLLTIGTEEVSHTGQLVSGARPNLTANPVYERATAFDGYETLYRGFVDVERIAGIAERVFPPAGVILEQLGLRGLEQLSFHGGFEHDKLRSTFALRMPGERQGLLRMLDAESELELDGLPKFPPDATTVYLTRFNLGTLYESIIDALGVGASVGGPDEVKKFREAVEGAEAALGIDLQNDLFKALGSTAAVYIAPSEGPLNLGTAVAIRVVDAEKVRNSLKQLIRTLPATTGTDVRLREREYRGTTVYSVNVAAQGFVFAPTYAITEGGWLVIGLYPQQVQGFLYRNSGDHAGWEQPAVLETSLASVRSQSGTRVIAVGVNDPRAGLEQVLSLAPVVVKFFTGFSGVGSSFDVGLIPPAQSVTDPLTHNVTVVADDGETLRWESYVSLPMPLQLNGIELYGFLGLYFAFGAFLF